MTGAGLGRSVAAGRIDIDRGRMRGRPGFTQLPTHFASPTWLTAPIRPAKVPLVTLVCRAPGRGRHDPRPLNPAEARSSDGDDAAEPPEGRAPRRELGEAQRSVAGVRDRIMHCHVRSTERGGVRGNVLLPKCAQCTGTAMRLSTPSVSLTNVGRRATVSVPKTDLGVPVAR